jgi:uncharacterized protein with PhoU and TrkA domain
LDKYACGSMLAFQTGEGPVATSSLATMITAANECEQISNSAHSMKQIVFGMHPPVVSYKQKPCEPS